MGSSPRQRHQSLRSSLGKSSQEQGDGPSPCVVSTWLSGGALLLLQKHWFGRLIRIPLSSPSLPGLPLQVLKPSQVRVPLTDLCPKVSTAKTPQNTCASPMALRRSGVALAKSSCSCSSTWGFKGHKTQVRGQRLGGEAGAQWGHTQCKEHSICSGHPGGTGLNAGQASWQSLGLK